MHIVKKCQVANHQLHNIRAIRNYLSRDTAEILVHGLVHSHLDFCNGLFVNMPKYQTQKLQVIQNRAARIITRSKYDQPSQPIRKSLHWLPVEARIIFKILSFVHKCLHGKAPSYLQDLLAKRVNTKAYTLRSFHPNNLTIPKTQTKLCERSF